MRKRIAEGFGPVYEKGVIAPGYEGLGPKFEKDLGPMIKMKSTPRKQIIPKKKEQKYRTPPAKGKRHFA